MRTAVQQQPPLGTRLNSSHSLSNMAAYFPLNEGGGQKALDNRSYKVGVLTNGALFKQSLLGSCVSFDGTNDYISCSTIAIPTSSVFTYAAFVNSTGAASQGVICATTGNNAPYFRVNSDLKIALLKNNASQFAVSSSSISSGVWSHIAVSYDISGNYALYINGKNVGSGTSVQTFIFGTFTIGSQGGVNEFFTGLIQDVRIYNRALLASEIRQLYSSPYSMFIGK